MFKLLAKSTEPSCRVQNDGFEVYDLSIQ